MLESEIQKGAKKEDNLKFLEIITDFKEKFPDYSNQQIISALCKLANSDNPLFLKDKVIKFEEFKDSWEGNSKGRRGRGRRGGGGGGRRNYSGGGGNRGCLLYTSPSPRDRQKSRMPSSA